MTGNGYVGPLGKYLSVNFDKKDWHIMIRRADNKSCDSFRQYHGRTATCSDVEQFLPNWNSLKWHHSSLPGSRGLSAHDGEFSVRLLTTEDSSLSDEQILAGFTEFMSNRTREEEKEGRSCK